MVCPGEKPLVASVPALLQQPRAHQLQHEAVVPVIPGRLLRGQQLKLDQFGLERHQSDGLKLYEVPVVPWWEVGRHHLEDGLPLLHKN